MYPLIRTQVLTVAVICSMALATPADATVIASHSGTSNPTGEGFGLTSAGTLNTDYSLGAVSGAWNINTTIGSNVSRAFYTRTHSAPEQTLLNDSLNTVIFTATFQVLDDSIKNNSGTAATFATFSIGTTEWLFLMGLNSSDGLVIGAAGQTNIVLASGLTSHTLELRDLDADDVSGSAGLQRDFDVYVDNVFQYTWAGAAGTANRTGFGDGTVTANEETDVNWTSVQLQVSLIPEPAANVLLCLGSIGFSRLVRRKRILDVDGKSSYITN